VRLINSTFELLSIFISHVILIADSAVKISSLINLADTFLPIDNKILQFKNISGEIFLRECDSLMGSFIIVLS